MSNSATDAGANPPDDLHEHLLREFSPAIFVAGTEVQRQISVLKRCVTEAAAEARDRFRTDRKAKDALDVQMEWARARLWQTFVQPELTYIDYVKTLRYQEQLVALQRRLHRMLTSIDADLVHSAIFDIVHDTLRLREPGMREHPLRCLGRFPTEQLWWNYFEIAARRRALRARQGQDTLQTLEERAAEAAEFQLLPEDAEHVLLAFPPRQRKILKAILEGDLTTTNAYSENYVRKVLRRAVAYFRQRDDSNRNA